MVRISKDSQLIEEISGLINNSNISTQELEILSNAKNKLEQKKYTPKVVAELKSNLAPLARNLSLSKDVVFFYTRLSQEFIASLYWTMVLFNQIIQLFNGTMFCPLIKAVLIE
ncbi:bacteriocin immunity protein [Lactococcus cremoris]|uniref:bacteriocin immunity protein n=1 Tax=Lactococcus lactis subsp. cremoris TaxID=1359 RepID=UPI0040471E2A